MSEHKLLTAPEMIVDRVPSPRFEPLLIAALFVWTVSALLRFWRQSGSAFSFAVPEIDYPDDDPDDYAGNMSWLN